MNKLGPILGGVVLYDIRVLLSAEDFKQEPTEVSFIQWYEVLSGDNLDRREVVGDRKGVAAFGRSYIGGNTRLSGALLANRIPKEGNSRYGLNIECPGL